MDFTLRIMGSASAMPVSGRYQSAHVLNVHGRLFLIDCGEGVQLQMVRYGVPMMKLDSIFISHAHGDHVFGLMGLLSTLGMKSRTIPLNIYGPPNLAPLLGFFQSFYGDGLSYEIRFTPVSVKGPEVIYSTKNLEVLAFPLHHKIATFGYLIREKEPMLNVRKEAVTRYGLTLAEIGALKRGEDVLRPAGPDNAADFLTGFVKNSGGSEAMLLRASELAYKPYNPRSYAYVSDTATFPELVDWVRGADLLYHETTFLQEMEDQASARFHSTTRQAAQCALDAGVGKLVIGHYSSRCRDIKAYERECREIFPETYAASDGDVFDIAEKIR